MSRLIFKPDTGLQAPDTAEIRSRVVNDWVNAFASADMPELNTEHSTPAGQLIDAQVAEIEAKNAELLYLANMFDPRVADGRWQEALGYIYFLNRKKDEPTVVTCCLTGLNGTVVPYGAIARTLDGVSLLCNREVTIDTSGQAVTSFRTTMTGPVEIGAHSVTKIITTIPGWDSIDNEAPGAIGRNLETRAEFEARRHASVAANAHGSVSSLYGTIANLEGVLDVQVLENVGPDPVVKRGVIVPGHGITVCVYGGSDEAIARAIYQKKDAGCDTGGNTTIAHIATEYSGALYSYKIMRPTPVALWVRIILGSGNPLSPAVEAAIKEAVLTDFLGTNQQSSNPRVGLASTLYASRFYSAVINVDGVDNLLNIEAALGHTVSEGDYRQEVSINGDQEPVMTTENISLIVRG